VYVPVQMARPYGFVDLEPGLVELSVAEVVAASFLQRAPAAAAVEETACSRAQPELVDWLVAAGLEENEAVQDSASCAAEEADPHVVLVLVPVPCQAASKADLAVVDPEDHSVPEDTDR
jgi:hypothetical protein